MSRPAISLVIASRLEDVFLVGSAIKQIAHNCGFDEQRAFQAELAVVEAVNNVIEHGYDGEGTGRIEVMVERGTNELVFSVIDNGHPIASEVWSRVESCQADEEISDRGRGLMIMRSFTDGISYASRDGRNILVLRKLVSQNAVSHSSTKIKDRQA
jgi:serine/threonine-protein kinase RsbW